MERTSSSEGITVRDVLAFAQYVEKSADALALLQRQLKDPDLNDGEVEEIESALSNIALSYMRPRNIPGQDLFAMKCAYMLLAQKMVGKIESIQGVEAERFLKRFPYIRGDIS